MEIKAGGMHISAHFMAKMGTNIGFVGTFVGNVSDLHFIGLNLQSKFVPIHEQPNHNIVHLNRLGETDRFAC